MEHLVVNHELGISAEMDMMLSGRFVGHFRVITRDLDADRVIAVRYWPQHMRDCAIVYADGMVDGRTTASAFALSND